MLPHEFASDGCYKTDGIYKECQNSFLINTESGHDTIKTVSRLL